MEWTYLIYSIDNKCYSARVGNGPYTTIRRSIPLKPYILGLIGLTGYAAWQQLIGVGEVV